MIPILYESTEKEFKSNGIGKLSDAIDLVVTEERNGIFELTMTYPISGIHYSDIQVRRIILAKPSWAQDPQPFDIVKVTPSTDGMTAEIYAQHISYRLSNIPVKPFTATGMINSLEGLVKNSLIKHDFTVWSDIDNNETEFNVTVPKSFRACLGGTEGSILQTFSGSGSMEFMWDDKTVKVYRDRGQNKGVTIKYGKNLTSLKQETSIEDCYTGILAYWTDSQTSTVMGDIQYIENHEKYPRERIFIYDATQDFQNNDSTEENKKPTVSELNDRAKKYIESNDIGKPSINLEVSFVDLSQTEEYKDIAPLERVNLCDTVTVYFPKLGVNATAKVIKTEWDVLNDRYNSIELGDTKSSFADTIKQEAHDAVDPMIKQLPSMSFVRMAIDEAKKLIMGGTSGHMIVGTNANGEANELYFMDMEDRATAKNVLRLNMNGIAFSQDGIDGTYTTAWTIKGSFVADFITSGILRAGLIKTGILSDVKGNNYWNMDTGEFKLQSVKSIGDYADEKKEINDYADNQANKAREDAEKKAQDLADNASSLAKKAQEEADKKIVTFYQNTAPAETSSGDLWIDTDDGNSLHRWDGKQWVNVQDAKMQKALTAANTAQSTADGKIVTYSQKNEPTGNDLTVGDLWFNPDDNNHLKRWNGKAWVEARDGFIQEAANNAQTNAEKTAASALQKFSEDVQKEVDKKVQVYYQNEAPKSGMDTSDLWIDTDDGNKLYRYDGETWVSVQDEAISDAITKANTAQNTADKKITCTASATQPEGATDGDLWIVTENVVDSTGTITHYAGTIWRYKESTNTWENWADARTADQIEKEKNAAIDASKKYTDEQNKSLDESLTQAEIFNRLTDNGVIKGIYMKDGQMYINASYLVTGILTDAKGNNTWDLTTGELITNNGTFKGSVIIPFSDGVNKGYTGTTVIDSKGFNIDAENGYGTKSKFNLSNGSVTLKGSQSYMEGDTNVPSSSSRDSEGIYTANNFFISCIGEDNYHRNAIDGTCNPWSAEIHVDNEGKNNHSEIRANVVRTYSANGSSIVSADNGISTTGTKSRIASTEDYGQRLLYCYETPTPMFGDVGEGVIGDDGLAYIQIDPTFSETVNTSQYQVFIQKYGEGQCYVSERYPTYFVVKGSSGLSFGWEIKAKQAGYDQLRLDKNEEKFTPEQGKYGIIAQSYIQSLNEGRILNNESSN